MVAHVLNVRAFRIELEFRSVGFWGEGKTGVPGEKPLGAEKRTNNKLNPHMTSSPGIEPGPHWWVASALESAGATNANVREREMRAAKPWAPSFLGAITREKRDCNGFIQHFWSPVTVWQFTSCPPRPFASLLYPWRFKMYIYLQNCTYWYRRKDTHLQKYL